MTYRIHYWFSNESGVGPVLVTEDRDLFAEFMKCIVKDQRNISIRYIETETDVFLSYTRTREGAKALQSEGAKPVKKPLYTEWIRKYI